VCIEANQGSDQSIPFADSSCEQPKHHLGVIFNYETWLSLTENWIFTQASHLPGSVTPYIVCGSTRNLDQYRLDNLFSFADLPIWRQVRTLAASLPALGIDVGKKSSLIAEVARQFGTSVVHSHFGYTGYYAARAVKKLGMKHVVTFYGVDMSAMPSQDNSWRDRYRELFTHADMVLCEGPKMADGVKQLGCPDEKIEVHHLGVRAKALPFCPRRWDPGVPLRVLIAGSFREKKGIPYALQALGALHQQVPVEVTIIGDAGNNPKSQSEKVRIHAAAERSGLGSNVTFMGYQPFSVMRDLAYQHHLFLSPSVTASDGDTEGGVPVSIIEMAATGMPVISTRHADIPEVIEDGVTGLLAEERDVDGLVSKLRWLADNRYSWDSLTRTARQRIECEFDADRQGERLANIYHRLVESG
jgi:colanic acid/amylovoran biosynthesis glycosyltransferase